MAEDWTNPWQGSETGGVGFGDFLTFRWMITPALITVIWVLSVIAISVLALSSIGNNPPLVLGGWVVGLVLSRVLFEVMVVLFKINDGIQEVARRGRRTVRADDWMVMGEPASIGSASDGLDADLPQLDPSHSRLLGSWMVSEASGGIFSPRERVSLVLSEGRLLVARGSAILYDPGDGELDVIVADDLFIRLIERGMPLVSLDWESGLRGKATAKLLKRPGD